ncbi:MAG TPA: hypothetical protein VE282_03290, partial [Gemmatimonadales bacterium]|nr:hypothetical protein [Gemmatimonadales bacterium]
MSSPSWYPRMLVCSVLATTVSLAMACGGGGPTEPPGSPPAEAILVAGNIATCGTTNDEATAAILDTLQGTIFTLGDNVFPDGSLEAYTQCYEPSWGRHKARTY